MTILIAVGIMLTLCLFRLNVVLALIVGAMAGGISAGMHLTEIVSSFTTGITRAADIALSYGLLGAFANALAHSGITDKIKALFHQTGTNLRKTHKIFLLLGLLMMGIASQNIIPIHIAFIPILVPPLLVVFDQMKIDRRLIACIITFGITCTYITVPVGFGSIYLNQVLGGNLATNGLKTLPSELPLAMLIPASGMILGLLIAVFFSYRKPRTYTVIPTIEEPQPKEEKKPVRIVPLLVVIFATLAVQLITQSMIMGALTGCLSIVILRLLPQSKSDTIFMEGLKIMAPCGFIMMAASGLAAVLQHSGAIPQMVSTVAHSIPDKGLLVFLMLLVGLLVTIGIGSSFSTVPIIAAIYVPIAINIGLSPMATIALVGTAGALGDAGSPASDSTIGPTSGLNMDGQHDHIRDTVIPTFLHYNIPLLITGWIGVMVL